MIDRNTEETDPADTPAALRAEVQERLARLPFPALTHLAALLLLRTGYTHVRVRRARFRGRNSGGGWDLEATQEAGLSREKVLVQIKRLAQPVQGRCVDELRGVLLRAGAGRGLLLTTGAFSPVARAAAQAVAPPVALVDGERLTDLLIRHRVGVAGEGRGALRLDEALFAGVEALTRPDAGGSAPECDLPAQRSGPRLPLTVTITVRRPGPSARRT